MAKGLTIRQERFCEEYLRSGNASEAYRIAYPGSLKWNDKAVWAKASLLIKTDKVEIRVKELQKQQAERSEVKREEILKFCADVLRGADVTDQKEVTPSGSRKRTVSKTWAVERICKMLGYDAPIEVTTRSGDVDMTKEELEGQIKRIRKARGEE